MNRLFYSEAKQACLAEPVRGRGFSHRSRNHFDCCSQSLVRSNLLNEKLKTKKNHNFIYLLQVFQAVNLPNVYFGS